MSALSANQRGIVALIVGLVSYTINDSMVKSIAYKYPVGEVIFVRGAMTAALVGAAVLILGYGRELRHAVTKPVLLRSLFDGLSTACFIVALVHMKLADIAAVLQVAPLILTALSVMVFREHVGWRRWAAILVGFTGAMLVAKPTLSGFDVWALVGIAAAFMSALRDLLNRRIKRDVPTVIIAFMGAVGILAAGAVFAAAGEWKPMPAADLGLLAGASLFIGLATYMVALAFRNVDLSVVAPFRYTYLITSAVAGYLIFSELPDGWSLVGTALIVGSGLYALHREAVRRRELSAQSNTAL